MSNQNENATESASAEGLDTIKVSCLRPIFMYLNVVDAVNLAASSTRLRNFANSDYFPMKAKHITVEKNKSGRIILTAPLDNGFTSEIQSTEKIKFLFSYLGESMENLKIIDAINWSTISEMINKNKLPKLRSFAYKGRMLTTSASCMVSHYQQPNINSTMETFSENGIIEVLLFEDAVFAAGGNATPFRFDRLKHFRLFSFITPSCDILRALTEAHMPVIQSFDIDLMFFISFIPSYLDYEDICSEELSNLLSFLKSKKTLKTIRLASQRKNVHIPFEFFEYIIEILSEPCTPKRPLLRLEINAAFKVGADEVR